MTKKGDKKNLSPLKSIIFACHKGLFRLYSCCVFCRKFCVMRTKINFILLFILIVFAIESFAKTMTLKRTVSHTRNLDQISLTFKESAVELHTNVFQLSRQNMTSSPRLGHFETSITPELRSLKEMLTTHHGMLNRHSSVQPSRLIPHAPVLHLNEQKVDYSYLYSSHLESVFNRARQRNWSCVRCAEYKKDGDSILRIVRNRGQKEKRRTFSLEDLNCRYMDEERIECIDPQFGIFEIAR